MVTLDIDQKKIEQALMEFEDAVDFELVPVIARQSIDLGFLRSFVVVVCLVVSLFVSFFIVELSWVRWTLQERIILVLCLAMFSTALGFVLSRWQVLLRRLLTPQQKHQAALAQAQRIFFLKRFYETKSHRAMLLYISLLERQIVILPDPRLELPQMSELSRSVLKTLQASFANNEYDEGLVAAIHQMKVELLPHFKRNQQAPNEIANKLIWWNE